VNIGGRYFRRERLIFCKFFLRETIFHKYPASRAVPLQRKVKDSHPAKRRQRPPVLLYPKKRVGRNASVFANCATLALVEWRFNRAAEAVCLSRVQRAFIAGAERRHPLFSRATYRRSPCRPKAAAGPRREAAEPSASFTVPQARVRFQIDNWLALHQDLATTAGWRVPVRRLSGG
jgi:hypothetical protein